MAYKLREIAACYNRSPRTTKRHIDELIQKGRFKKESMGKQFDQLELEKLQRLLRFQFKKMT